MNVRLGDDQGNGWLLLGGPGQALDAGGAVPASDGGSQGSAPMGSASALAQALAAGGGSQTGAGGRGGGSGGGTGSRRSLP